MQDRPNEVPASSVASLGSSGTYAQGGWVTIERATIAEVVSRLEAVADLAQTVGLGVPLEDRLRIAGRHASRARDELVAFLALVA